MIPFCRACGTEHNVGFCSEWALADLGLKSLPDWLFGLCNECLQDLSRHVPADDAGNPLSEVSADHLVLFLAQVTHLYAGRVGAKLSVDRCEVLAPSIFSGVHDHQCRRFATCVVGGRRMCGLCRSGHTRGRPLAFVGERQFSARPFLIWARSGEELIEIAVSIAAEIKTRAA